MDTVSAIYCQIITRFLARRVVVHFDAELRYIVQT